MMLTKPASGTSKSLGKILNKHPTKRHGGLAFSQGSGFVPSVVAGPNDASTGTVDCLMPTVEQFVRARDYAGALAILDFTRRMERVDGGSTLEYLLWRAYCAFHMGEYEQALHTYEGILRGEHWASDGEGRDLKDKKTQSPNKGHSQCTDGTAEVAGPKADTSLPEVHLFRACCHYYMQQYEEAERAAMHGPLEEGGLRTRLLFHIAHKQGNETKLLHLHHQLSDGVEDQLSLAAIHYLRSHFQEAVEVYKRLLLEHRDDVALNVYVALCYYKMDHYDVVMEILAAYLQAHPGSLVALNLKACTTYRLYNGKAAEAELQKGLGEAYGVDLQEHALLRHNLVVFRGGEGALRVLPPLVDVIPEARLNLVIYYLRHNGTEEAFELMRHLEPSTPQEYILKGIVNAGRGLALGSREHLKTAQQLFQLVGASASECDTIPGRQSMASCFFLLKNFEDVNTYLSSIRTYMGADDDFHWNYGISLAAVGDYQAAEESLFAVRNEEYKAEPAFLAWLCRCCIMNGNPHYAWELYLQADATAGAAATFALLQLVANDCYRMGHFLLAAKAFHVLERLDPDDPEYWEGKRGACAGVLQLCLAGTLPKEELQEAMILLREGNVNNPQAEYMLRVMKKYAME
ncbi:tetratricopeptide repeat protein 26 [Nannochloropsis gaditana]|uniref:Tetratricopeptide repeat protein 26 n=2 Tax=Nannochloropsis gaditana TaxID=72520 RepID=W7U0Q4_9STRA|nr:tetratricopeptide repeat protein 26 [Nannochloropsis gaditana]